MKMKKKAWLLKVTQLSLANNCDAEYGFIEIIDKNALNGANLKDVPLKYNHTDNRLILAVLVTVPYLYD